MLQLFIFKYIILLKIFFYNETLSFKIYNILNNLMVKKIDNKN